MKGEDISKRLLAFSADVLRIVGELPTTVIAKHVARQLVRAGTAGGANYEEARAAESRADFAHKVSIAAKEVGETVYWLQLIEAAGLLTTPPRAQLVREGNEIVAILKSSARTARRRAG
jgi:four helix bundle protein